MVMMMGVGKEHDTVHILALASVKFDLQSCTYEAAIVN